MKTLLTTSLIAALMAGSSASAGGLSLMHGSRQLEALNTARPAKVVKASSISVDDGNGGWKPYVAPAKSKVRGSSSYEGKTTTVTDNAVTTTDERGVTTTTPRTKPGPGISVDDGNGGWKPYVPPAKSKELGSSTDGGKTTTVTDNGDGTHTVKVRDRDGKETSEVRRHGFPISNVIGYGTDGLITRTVTDIGGGFHTLTIADDAGNSTVEVHKTHRAPKALKHVTRSQSGWTYWLMLDPDTGETFIQIDDANGNALHFDGAMAFPGGDGTMYAIR